MLDPALVRDHMDLVRYGPAEPRAEDRRRAVAARDARDAAPRAAAAGRGSQTGAERGGRGGCACEARRARPLGDLRGEQDARAAHPPARGRGRRGRGAAFGAPHDAPESASRERADWHVRRGQPGSSAARRPSRCSRSSPNRTGTSDRRSGFSISNVPRVCPGRDSRCCSARARGSRAR